ncbi:MAG: FUSC family protein [Azonexus sp.]|nr:FUSC family protein [Azonexus sp.]
MSRTPWWERLQAQLRREWNDLTTVNRSDRRWTMPFCAALASGLPLLVGVWFGHIEFGLISSIGGLVFLYLPETPLSHRMVLLLASAFAMCACFALGLMSQFLPGFHVLVLTFIAVLVSMLCRFYQIAPPGSLFFVLAAAIGVYTPAEVLDVPLRVGLFTMGCLLACLIAFFYSLEALRQKPPQPIPPLAAASFDFVIFDSIVIGGCVGISLALARLFELDRPYWVPVSCLAVIQSLSLRAVWSKQLQRILGTALGVVLAGALLRLPLDPWSIAAMVMLLTFIVETMIVRHYGLAMIFTTPLTIFLADASYLGHAPTADLLEARLLDTVLGSLVGLIGGIGLYSPRFRQALGRQIRRLTPARLRD